MHAARMTPSEHLHFFGGPAPVELRAASLVGLKGAGLLELAAAGLPVPAGVVLDVALCEALHSGSVDAETLVPAIVLGLEERTGRRMGAAERPLLVSVRSSGTHSMPGLMDTLLNVGMTPQMLAGSPAVLADAFRRLVVGFGSVVFGLRPPGRGGLDPLRTLVERACDDAGVEDASQLPVDALHTLGAALVAHLTMLGHTFPQTAEAQLARAMTSVLASAGNERMTAWQREHGGPQVQTALVIQQMVMGNAGSQSGTGVAMSRHPTTGERRVFGEFLKHAQGEDLLGGFRTPAPLKGGRPGQATLESVAPDALVKLEAAVRALETARKDVQEIEFTVEEGTLWLLQTRPAKRTARAAVKIAVDLVQEGALQRKDALLSVNSSSLAQLMAPQVSAGAVRDVLGHGVPASVGVATGRVVFHAQDALAYRQRGVDSILVRTETSADDLPGMEAAVGVVTSRGGTTSHAAVVCRTLGKCCVVGCGDLRVNYGTRQLSTNTGRTISEGDVVTVDAHTGDILLGSPELEVQPGIPELAPFMAWADEARRVRVLVDVDNAQRARLAARFGADGIARIRAQGADLRAVLEVCAGRGWIRLPEQRDLWAGIVATALGATDAVVQVLVVGVRSGEALEAARRTLVAAGGDRVSVGAEVGAEPAELEDMARHADLLVLDTGALKVDNQGALIERLVRAAGQVPVGVALDRGAPQQGVAWVAVPLRAVPGARLAAAQAALIKGGS